MKKITLYSIFVSVIFLILLYGWYLPRINYYEPLNVEVTGLNGRPILPVKLYGITPLTQTPLALDSSLTGRNKTAGLFAELYLCLPDTVLDSVQSITVHHGSNVFTINSDSIYLLANRKTHLFYLPKYTNQDASKTVKLYFLIYCLLHLPVVQLLYKPFIFLLLSGCMLVVYKQYRKGKYIQDFKKVNISIYIICLLCGITYMSTFSYPDKVWLGGDSWEYQSIAVNAANQKGFPVDGGIVDSADYHFYTDSLPFAQTWKAISSKKPAPSFYRNPVYPLFIAGVYKVFSADPKLLRMVQFLLLVLAGSLLPYIGYRISGARGILPGFFAYLLFLVIDHRYAFEVMTEALSIPYAIILVLASLVLNYRSNRVHAVCLGVLLALGVLLKTCFIPVLLFYTAYLLYGIFISKNTSWKQVVIIAFSCLLTVAPWTIYANYVARNSNPHAAFFLITTQGTDVLLGSNNEYAADGEWHPEWKEHTNSYYNQAALKDEACGADVVRFYCTHPQLIVPVFTAKIIKGFVSSNAQLIFYISVLLWFVVNALPVFRKYNYPGILIFLFIFSLTLANLFGCIETFQNIRFKIFSAPNCYLFICGILLLCAFAFSKYYRELPYQVSRKYFLCIVLISCFLLLTIVFYGSERIDGVIDFIFLLLALQIQFDLLNPQRRHSVPLQQTVVSGL